MIGSLLRLLVFSGDAATQPLHTLVQRHFHLWGRGVCERGAGENIREWGETGERRGEGG